MGKLTIKKVENAAPREKEYKLHDGEGLFLRVRPSGAKSWLFSFSLPGDKKVIRMTLGSTDKLSLKEARSMLPALHKLVSEGIDPRNARAATQAENSQAITMQKLFDAWIETEKIAKNVTTTWIKRHEDRWRLHLKNHLGKLLARDVNRAHLAAALDAMMRKGIREETRKALTTLNLLLDYGLARNLIEQNPARMLKPKDFKSTANKPRDRALSLSELQQLWSVLTTNQNNSLSIMTINAIKLLILTGARRKEVAGMRWDELDFNENTWRLPAERTKNGCAHIIYLSTLAIEIINSLRPISGQFYFVFNNQAEQEKHLHPDTLTTAVARLQGAKKDGRTLLNGIKSFTVHDLRRSVATAWGEYLKVSPHVIERMLNHQPENKLMATYQRALYSEEQKTAWIAWGKMVREITMEIKPVEHLILEIDKIGFKGKKCSLTACNNKPIRSHTIPENFLYKLSSELKNVLMVQPGMLKVIKKDLRLIPVNTNEFSTFTGFCYSCDHKKFKLIDEFDGEMSKEKAALNHYRIICYGINHIETQILRYEHISKQNYIEDGQLNNEGKGVNELIKSGDLLMRLYDILGQYLERKVLLESMIGTRNFDMINFREIKGEMNNPLFFGRSNHYLHPEEECFSLPGYSAMPWLSYITLLSEKNNHLIFCWLKQDENYANNINKMTKEKLEILAFGLSDAFAITEDFYIQHKQAINEIIIDRVY